MKQNGFFVSSSEMVDTSFLISLGVDQDGDMRYLGLDGSDVCTVIRAMRYDNYSDALRKCAEMAEGCVIGSGSFPAVCMVQTVANVSAFNGGGYHD